MSFSTSLLSSSIRFFKSIFTTHLFLTTHLRKTLGV
nr:MAG TPA: hypothetical protein [Caudoviricetes sp.]